ncbi:MAG TPA: hypothetical protein VEI97_15655, partial [bacterium]|nr:hypothetical protein [bacterium]
ADLLGLVDPGGGGLVLVAVVWPAEGQQPQGRFYPLDPEGQFAGPGIPFGNAIPPAGQAEAGPDGTVVVYPSPQLRVMPQRFNATTGLPVSSPPEPLPPPPPPARMKLGAGSPSLRTVPGPVLFRPAVRLVMLLDGNDVAQVVGLSPLVTEGSMVTLSEDVRAGAQRMVAERGTQGVFSDSGLRIYEWNADHALVVQGLRPSPVEVAGGRGVLRIGLLNLSPGGPPPQVRWQGWLPFPTVDAGYALGEPGLRIHASEAGWLLGLHLTIVDAAAPQAPPDWYGWTLVAPPAGFPAPAAMGWRAPGY